MWHAEFAELLRQDFEAHKARNPKYSLRAYAKKLHLGISSISELLHGKKKWGLSPARAKAILETLPLSPTLKNRLLVKMGEQPEHDKKTLPPTDYDLLTKWAYYPVLFSFDLPPHLAQPAKIAERLGLPVGEVEKIIDELLARGLLVRNQEKIERPTVFLQTSDGVTNDVLREHHERNLELSLRALRELPTPKRDFTSLTFAGSLAQIEILRKEIRQLHEKASTLMDGEEKNDQVFRLSVQLFPVEFPQ